MMNRRRALMVIGAAAFGGVGRASSTLVRFLQPGLLGERNAAIGPRPRDAADKAADDRLREDLARMASRANSEEGVPVFLGCMNLATSKASQRPPSASLTALNTDIAAEFRRTAEAWKRIRPNPPKSDVATLIEVLADRDFSSAGKEAKP